MRRPVFFATWKSNKTPKEVLEFFEQVYKRGLELENIPVQVIVNTDAYEVSGLPESVTAMIIGDASDVQLVKSQTSYKVTADLSGLTEGTHQIKLTPVDFSNRLSPPGHKPYDRYDVSYAQKCAAK